MKKLLWVVLITSLLSLFMTSGVFAGDGDLPDPHIPPSVKPVQG